jgi:uncharacterized membrane-anchored protein YitT (DUF2179 family)
MEKWKKVGSYAVMLLLGMIAAFNYAVFVFPNDFAPSGVDGVCTMIQYLLGTNIGYLALIVNVPLLVAGACLLSVEFTVKSILYIGSFSLTSILIEIVDISAFVYHTDAGSVVLAPVAGGVVRGLLYVFTIKNGGSSGGIDVIAEIVHKFKPHFNLMNVIFAINCGVAAMAYFVYGFTLEPVLCSVLYSFVTSTVSNRVQAGKKESVRFEMITSQGGELCAEIARVLRQTATVVQARGAYSGSDKQMVICVTEKKNVPVLEKILQSYPDSVTFESVIQNSIFAYRA